MAPPVTQPTPYPEKDASKVRRVAQLTAHQPAIDALELVKDMIGHPGNVQKAANSWEAALIKLQASQNDIASAKSEVAPQWVGGAAIAFTSHTTTIEKRITDNVTAFSTVINSTMEMYGAVITAYQKGVEFISKCAQALFSLWGGVLGDVKTWVGAGAAATGIGTGPGMALMASHFTELLSDMTDAISGLVQGVLDATKDYNKALAAITSGLGTVLPPPGMPGRLKSPEAWRR